MKNIILFIFFSLFAQLGLSQHSFYAGASFDIGVPSSNEFGSSGSKLSTHTLSGHYAGNLALQWRFMDQFSLELGIGQAYDTWRLRDNEFEERHNGFIIKLHNNHYSWNYFANLAYYHPLVENDLYLYGQLGYSFNQLSANTLNKHEEFEQVKNDVYENINMTTTYSAKNRSIIPEIGVQKKIGGNHIVSAGIKVNIGDAVIKSGDYDVLNLIDSTIITSDKYSSKGSFLALTIKYSYLLFEIGKKDPKEKPEKEKKEKKKREKPEKEKKEKKKREKKEKKKGKKKKEKYKKGSRSRSVETRYKPDDIFDDDYIPPSPY